MPIFLGSNAVKPFRGATEIKEAYLGSRLVYSSGFSLFPSSYTWTHLNSGSTPGSGSVTSTAMTITARSNGGYKWQCDTTIDFSNYRSMKIEYTVTNNHTGSNKFFAFQTSNSNIWNTANDFWYVTNPAAGDYSVTIDVSSLTTSFKPIFGVHAYTGSGTFKVVITSIVLS